MQQATTRNQIISAADTLFYQQGYAHTSFAHIADAVKISRGNFYYHFRTKDEILEAVIAQRMDATKQMLKCWEQESEDPRERIKCYMRIVISNWDKIRHFGCPVGTLSLELSKLSHASQEQARAIFSIFRHWLTGNFRALDCGRESDALAMTVLAWSQGVATLGNSFQDEKFVRREVRRMCQWLDAMAAE